MTSIWVHDLNIFFHPIKVFFLDRDLMMFTFHEEAQKWRNILLLLFYIYRQ